MTGFDSGPADRGLYDDDRSVRKLLGDVGQTIGRLDGLIEEYLKKFDDDPASPNGEAVADLLQSAGGERSRFLRCFSTLWKLYQIDDTKEHSHKRLSPYLCSFCAQPELPPAIVMGERASICEGCVLAFLSRDAAVLHDENPCSFCGQASTRRFGKHVAGDPNARICSDCVEFVLGMMRDTGPGTASPPTGA